MKGWIVFLLFRAQFRQSQTSDKVKHSQAGQGKWRVEEKHGQRHGGKKENMSKELP